MGRTRKLPAAAARPALGLFALLAGAAASAAGVLVANPGKMTRYEVQPGYTLVTVDNSQLKRDMTRLPRLKATLEKSLGIPVKSTGIPTYVYVVSDSIWDRYLELSSGIPSEFVPTRFANYIIANNTTINRINLFHEHTHLYLYNQMPGVYPVWFDEGLAVMMARAMYTGSKVEIYPARHGDEGGWIPISRVLRATRTSPEYLSQQQLYSLHFESHGLVYRALIDDTEFGKQVFKYLEAVNNIAAPAEAEAILGDLDDLNSKMRAYVNESGKKKVLMDVESGPDLVLPAGTPVSKLDSLLGIATVSLDGGLHLDMVHELLDAAAQEPGSEARVAAARMRLAARLKDDAALEKQHAVLAKDANDLQSARAAGLALYERARTLEPSAQRTDLSTRSLDLLNRSLASRADDPEAVWAHAMQAADLKRDMDIALQRLVPMFERLPSNPDMALAAGRLLYAKGDPNLKPYATAVLRYSNSIEDKRWAAERIAELKKTLGASGTN
jgi:hypothetical protein